MSFWPKAKPQPGEPRDLPTAQAVRRSHGGTRGRRGVCGGRSVQRSPGATAAPRRLGPLRGVQPRGPRPSPDGPGRTRPGSSVRPGRQAKGLTFAFSGRKPQATGAGPGGKGRDRASLAAALAPGPRHPPVSAGECSSAKRKSTSPRGAGARRGISQGREPWWNSPESWRVGREFPGTGILWPDRPDESIARRAMRY